MVCLLDVFLVYLSNESFSCGLDILGCGVWGFLSDMIFELRFLVLVSVFLGLDGMYFILFITLYLLFALIFALFHAEICRYSVCNMIFLWCFFLFLIIFKSGIIFCFVFLRFGLVGRLELIIFLCNYNWSGTFKIGRYVFENVFSNFGSFCKFWVIICHLKTFKKLTFSSV